MRDKNLEAYHRRLCGEAIAQALSWGLGVNLGKEGLSLHIWGSNVKLAPQIKQRVLGCIVCPTTKIAIVGNPNHIVLKAGETVRTGITRFQEELGGERPKSICIVQKNAQKTNCFVYDVSIFGL